MRRDVRDKLTRMCLLASTVAGGKDMADRKAPFGTTNL